MDIITTFFQPYTHFYYLFGLYLLMFTTLAACQPYE